MKGIIDNGKSLLEAFNDSRKSVSEARELNIDSELAAINKAMEEYRVEYNRQQAEAREAAAKFYITT